ncbi:MAG TPA: lytic murein transglycosylase [Solirubrobacterales bacterium]|nr:lytic murein transglycosylase [Solirubrobacterales bacterium]
MRRVALGVALMLVALGALTGVALATEEAPVEAEAAGEVATEAPTPAAEAAQPAEEAVAEEATAEEPAVEEPSAAEGPAAEEPAATEAPSPARRRRHHHRHERAPKVHRGAELVAPEAEPKSPAGDEAEPKASEATMTEAGVESEAETETEGALSSLSLGDGASTLDELEVPTALLPVYQACGSRYGIFWEVLAAINKVETGFGTDLGTSGAGAEGWMQFLPSSWEEWGIDADGDGRADTDDPVDAICSAARYLAASGGEADIYDAVLAYNHADWYAREVLALARRYERVPANEVTALAELAEGSTSPITEGKAEAVVDGTVAKVGDEEGRSRYVILTDAYGDRIVYSDLGSTKVQEGDTVTAGDELGTVGEATIGISIQPDGSTEIDPTELLKIWREGGAGAIYGVDAATTAGGEAGATRSLLMSDEALQREVLADGDLGLPSCVRQAVGEGEVARQSLAALEYLTGRGYEIGVSAATCDHETGFTLEIESVDGQEVALGQESGTAARELVQTVLGMNGSSAPQLISSATGIAAGETGGTTSGTIELDYRPPSTARIVDGDAVAPTDAPPAVQAMIAAANQIDDEPYVWGGGHGSWVSAGYDCSGSVSYVLHAAKMLASPETSGALESWGESGSGRWVTVYANSEHTYAVIAGLRWDTVGDEHGSGPRWHTGAAYPEGFAVRHPAGY